MPVPCASIPTIPRALGSVLACLLLAVLPAFAAKNEPSVRIPVQESDKVEEIREGGRVVMLKVTPAGGKPYYLLDTTGNGNWMRRDSLDDGLRVPQWPIKQWD